MLRLLFAIFLLSGCSLGVKKSGGDKNYIYDVHSDYLQRDLERMSPSIITTMVREPSQGQLSELFSKDQRPIKNVGIFVFESIIQPSRSGLSGSDLIYLTAQGKQLLAEKLLKVWDESFPILGKNELNYLKSQKLKKSKTFTTDGMNVSTYILGKRNSVQPDDIFYIEKGKNIETATVINPRKMRDFSLALVPASELMAGPKFSEHAKHTLNQVAKELGLDAMIIIQNKISWTASQIDKRSGDVLNEEAKIGIEATIAVPYSEYEERLRKLGGDRNLPQETLSYRFYKADVSIPVYISVEKENQNFSHIESELLKPILKTYNDLTQMVQLRIISDLKLTHK